MAVGAAIFTDVASVREFITSSAATFSKTYTEFTMEIVISRACRVCRRPHALPAVLQD